MNVTLTVEHLTFTR